MNKFKIGDKIKHINFQLDCDKIFTIEDITRLGFLIISHNGKIRSGSWVADNFVVLADENGKKLDWMI